MNGIGRLKHIEEYKKVNYYSICIEPEESEFYDVSLFEQFIANHGDSAYEKLNHILAWIAEIGNKYGAQEWLFRHEQHQGEAMGLPPKGMHRTPVYTEHGDITANNLRLYCHRLNEHVVILFSGGIKTTRTAQASDMVRHQFNLANKLTNAIDKSLIEKEIIWNESATDIVCSDDLTIYF